MRILICTTSYPSRRAPFNGVFVRSHAAALAARGHEVRVLVPHVFPEDPSVEEDGPVSVKRIAYGSDQRLLSDRAGLPLVMIGRLLLAWRKAARSEASQWCPDVVHAHWAIPSGMAARSAARRARVPLVVTVHGADMRLAARSGVARRLMQSVLSAAGAVVAVSQAFATEIGRGMVPGQPIAVIPMGVDTDVFASRSRREAREAAGLPPGAKIVLGIGALIPLKRFDDVIDALQIVRREVSDVRLLIAGEGRDRSALEGQAVSLGQGDAVTFLGAVEHDSLPDYLNAADVIVLASETEGLPVVLMEAAACGVPSVATDVGGSREVALSHPDARLVGVGDVPALARALVEVLSIEQPDVRPSVLGDGSPYSLSGAIQRLESVYRDLVGEES